LKQFVLIFSLLLSSFAVSASESSSDEEQVDAFGLIMDHISDSHQWHVIDYTNRHGNPVHISMPLPVILWHNNSLWFYSSDDFYHSDHTQPFGNDFVVLKDEHFYITDHNGTINTDEAGEITNASPLLEAYFSSSWNAFSNKSIVGAP
jgi:F-type H+-transporting ATPase subunit a